MKSQADNHGAQDGHFLEPFAVVHPPELRKKSLISFGKRPYMYHVSPFNLFVKSTSSAAEEHFRCTFGSHSCQVVVILLFQNTST